MDYFIGVDPGAKGAVAIISADLEHVTVFDYPGDYLTLKRLLFGMVEDGILIKLAAIEKQSPASGRTSSFSIGGNFNQWLMGFAMLDVRHTIVAPTAWQRVVFDSAKKAKDIKLVSMANASRRFPDVDLYGPKGGKLDGRADALNIALYARSKYGED